MTDLGQVKPTFVNWLHQKANLGHIISPTAILHPCSVDTILKTSRKSRIVHEVSQ